ncbi:MAG: hypothetical protein M1839_007625 [Geoglossum umbratile]|nr:MAG: hypothetical protein M1839_007625 [Geoglossum umbratile]
MSFRLPSARVQHLTIKERDVGILFRDSALIWNFDSQSSRDIALNTVDRDYRFLLFPLSEDCIVVFSQNNTEGPLIRFDKYTLDGTLLASASLELPFQLQQWRIQPCDYNGLYVVASHQLVSRKMTCLVRFDSKGNRLFSDEILIEQEFYFLWKDILISFSHFGSFSMAELEDNCGLVRLKPRKEPEFSQICGDYFRGGFSPGIYGFMGDENFLILHRFGDLIVWCFQEGIKMYDEDEAFRESSTSARLQRLEAKKKELASLGVRDIPTD